MTPEDVESQLDPQRFMRVNRQFIISAAAVQKLSIYFLGKMRIHMTAAPYEEIIVSKDKVATVKRWLDFCPLRSFAPFPDFAESNSVSE